MDKINTGQPPNILLVHFCNFNEGSGEIGIAYEKFLMGHNYGSKEVSLYILGANYPTKRIGWTGYTEDQRDESSVAGKMDLEIRRARKRAMEEGHYRKERNRQKKYIYSQNFSDIWMCIIEEHR